MEHINPMDMERFDEDGATVRRGPSRRGSLVRLGVGALAGALATGAFFVVRDGGPSSPAAQEVKTTTPSKPYLLKFASVPDDTCLQFASSFRDQPAPDAEAYVPTLYKRGDSDVLSVVVNQFGGGGPEAVVADTVDVNGRRGFYANSGVATTLSWKQGRTSVMMNARGLNRDELIAIARSVVLTFDENGARVGSINAPGFATEPLDASAFRGFGTLAYGACNANEPRSKSIFLATSPRSSMELSFGAFGAAKAKETPVRITRNGREVKARRLEVSYDNSEANTMKSITWVEKDVAVMVGFANLGFDSVLRSIDGLTEASADDYEALAKTAKRPEVPRPVLPGQSALTELRSIGMFKLGTMEGRVMSATQEDELCISLEYASGGGGGNCVGADREPRFTQAGGDGSNVIASAVVSASIEEAIATLPGGKTVAIPSFQDDRVPGLRVFVFARSKDDPVPTKISFKDASGKVVREQTSSDDLNSAIVTVSSIVAVPVPPTLASPTPVSTTVP